MGTSITTASETISKPTQRGLRYLQGPLTRRFLTQQKQLEKSLLTQKRIQIQCLNILHRQKAILVFRYLLQPKGFVAGKPMKNKSKKF
jgi:hypothetical protein